MPLVETHKLQPGAVPFQAEVYNALDCCVTLEVHEELARLASDPHTELIYAFERALQAPAMEMMLRGFRIDEYERQRGIAQLGAQQREVYSALQRLAYAVWDKELNPRSTKALQAFFYSHMRLPETWISQKGVRKLSMNREVLEKLEAYFHARPIIGLILAFREISKQLEVLETEIDSDGRMRTSYNIAGTETGRWSSSTSNTGTGTNLQNITPELRRMFIADPGWKLVGIDQEQAESRDVGWLCGTLFGEWGYLDACEHGDLHTTTARLVWPNLAWTDNPATDRKLAEQIFYRHFSYRDMSKRGGHGSNYLGTPWTMARHLKVPTKLVEDFQERYFDAFPGIPMWHRWVAQELQVRQELVTPYGRKRHFFGRPRDDTTLREAIAFVPQSSTGDRMNLGLWRLWKHMGRDDIQLLAQLHDAVYFQVRDGTEQEIVPKALELINVELSHAGRRFSVPGEAKIGWNWAAFDKDHPEKNPDGLVKFKPGVPDTRKRTTERIL